MASTLDADVFIPGHPTVTLGELAVSPMMTVNKINPMADEFLQRHLICLTVFIANISMLVLMVLTVCWLGDAKLQKRVP